MGVPTTQWDETSPAGTQSIKLGDNRIRELKTQIREIIAVDHEMTSTQTAATGGQHKQVTLQDSADLGTGATGKCYLGAQGAEGSAELVFTDEDDNDVQITTGGKLCVSSLTTVSSISTIMNLIYPIGYVITLGVSTNPGTLLGVGTWTAIEGMVIVGKAASGTFDTLDEELGSETVDASHTHSVSKSGWGRDAINATEGTIASAYAGNAADINTNLTTGSAGSATQSTLQPSITKYVWQRTA